MVSTTPAFDTHIDTLHDIPPTPTFDTHIDTLHDIPSTPAYVTQKHVNMYKLDNFKNTRPIFLSNHTDVSMLCGLEDCEETKMLNPSYSNNTFGHFNNEDDGHHLKEEEEVLEEDVRKLEEDVQPLMSCLSYNPEFQYCPFTLMCYIVNPRTKKRKKIKIALDSCSNITILKDSVAKELELEGKTVNLSFDSTGCISNSYKNREDVEFTLRDVFGKYESSQIQAVTLPKVSTGCQRITINPKEFSHLKHIEDFTEDLPQSAKQFKKHPTVQLLLGLPWVAMINQGTSVSTFGPPEPIAAHTKLGSALSFSTNHQHQLIHQNHLTDPDLTMFMRLDILGITDFPDEDNHLTLDEQLAETIVKNGTTYNEVKKEYTTCLPWKVDSNKQPIKIQETNKAQALATGYQWLKRLQKKSPELIELWVKSYQDMLDQGFSQKVPEKDLAKQDNYHYIQTFPVFRLAKTSHPARIVFAANQKQKISKQSLNDHLLQGPTYLKDLVHLILKCRLHPFIFQLDITKFFNRFKLIQDDQDFLRFFAIKKQDDNYIFESHKMISIPFGLKSSPFLCCFLLKQHSDKFLEEEELAEAAKQIKENSYVDDVILMSFQESALLPLVNGALTILNQASMHTHKYVSNSKETLKAFKEELVSTKETVSLLGAKWNPTNDILTYNLIKPTEDKSKVKKLKEEEEQDEGDKEDEEDEEDEGRKTIYTKRMVLSTLASCFDPQGLVSPFLLLPKLILQAAWKMNLQWDEPLPPDLQEQFEEFTLELPQLENISIKRCILPTPKSKLIELVTYADASAEAYGAACYAITEDEEGNRKSNLIFAKSRIRPIGKRSQALDKDMSIARLELMASWLATRCSKFCQEALDPTKKVRCRYFSDSQVTLHRLRKNPNDQKVFVANRVRSIQESTNAQDWFFVSTQENPADFCSRGTKLKDFIANRLWTSGPSYLEDPDTDYESMRIVNIQLSKELARVIKEETKNTTPFFNHQLYHCQTSSSSSCSLGLRDPVDMNLINEDFIKFYMEINTQNPKKSGLIQRFFTWDKLRRVVARIFQFIIACKKGWAVKLTKKPKPKNLMKMKIEDTKKNQERLNHHLLSSEQIQDAELFLFRLSQYLKLKEEIFTIKEASSEKTDTSLKKSSILYRLRPFWDYQDCVIRMKSRIPASNLIILPKNHRISQLFVTYHHVTNNHCGSNALRARVENVAYLLGGKNEYKRLTLGCVCRKPKPLHQQMSDLPIERVPLTFRAYAFIACDYGGPFFTYEGPQKKEQKCWVLVITCLVSRHITVELVPNCSTEAFMEALRSHVAINGKFQKCWSDQGSYFRKGDVELKKLLRKINFSKVQQSVNQEWNADWEFSVPHAPWRMGIVESCIKLFKTSLDIALKTTYKARKTPQFFNFQQLRVICQELASIINDRPLCVISEDVKGESTEIHVSPNHLVKGRTCGIVPVHAKFQDVLATSTFDIKLLYQTRRKIINIFWNQYLGGYRRTLKFTPKWLEEFNHDIPEGTYVLIKKEGMKVGQFTPALVVGVVRRPNGKISKLNLKSSEHKNIIQRDIRNLFLMEYDFLRLTHPNKCKIAHPEEEEDQGKKSIQVPLNTTLHTYLTSPDPSMPKQEKRGSEGMFSMMTYVPQAKNN